MSKLESLLEDFEKAILRLDHRTSLIKIKSLAPEVIYIMNRARGLADVLKQAKELNIDIPFLGMYGVESTQLLDLVGKEILEGIIYTTSTYDPESSDSLTAEFNKKSEEKYGHKAEYFSALGYDNMKILAGVMRGCDEPEDTICIRDGLFAIQYQGVTGETSFNALGDARKPIMFLYRNFNNY